MDASTILAAAHRLEMVDALAATETAEDHVLLVQAVRRVDEGDRVSGRFGGGIAEDCFRAAVPAGDNPVEVLADDGVIGGFDDRREIGAGALGEAMAGNVDEHIDG